MITLTKALKVFSPITKKIFLKILPLTQSDQLPIITLVMYRARHCWLRSLWSSSELRTWLILLKALGPIPPSRMLYQALELRRSCWLQQSSQICMFSVVILVSCGTLFIWVLALGNTPMGMLYTRILLHSKKSITTLAVHTRVCTHTHSQSALKVASVIGQSMSDVQCIDRASVCQS